MQRMRGSNWHQVAGVGLRLSCRIGTDGHSLHGLHAHGLFGEIGPSGCNKRLGRTVLRGDMLWPRAWGSGCLVASSNTDSASEARSKGFWNTRLTPRSVQSLARESTIPVAKQQNNRPGWHCWLTSRIRTGVPPARQATETGGMRCAFHLRRRAPCNSNDYHIGCSGREKSSKHDRFQSWRCERGSHAGNAIALGGRRNRQHYKQGIR
jgi:hypothetical protein